MPYFLLPALLALACLPAGATPTRPDDPRAAVPDTIYRASAAYRPAERHATTPDRHWLEANRTVLGYNPMMLTMPPRPAPQAPAPGPAPDAQPADPPAHEHGGHAGHDKKGGH